MKSEVLKSVEGQNTKSFDRDTFDKPTPEHVKVLQQSILAGFVENFTREATLFDQQGNEIKQTNKARKVFESQSVPERLKVH